MQGCEVEQGSSPCQAGRCASPVAAALCGTPWVASQHHSPRALPSAQRPDRPAPPLPPRAGMSYSFSSVDLAHLAFPSIMKIDHVRCSDAGGAVRVRPGSVQGRPWTRLLVAHFPSLSLIPPTSPPQAVPADRQDQHWMLAQEVPHESVPGLQQGEVCAAEGGQDQDPRQVPEHHQELPPSAGLDRGTGCISVLQELMGHVELLCVLIKAVQQGV